MKKMAVVIVLLILLAAPAMAGGFKDLSVHAGYSLPTGNMADESTGGLQLGGGLGLQVGPQVTMGFEYSHNWYGLTREMKEYVDDTLGEGGDLDLAISQYTLYGKVHILPAASTLYSKFCAGFYTASATASQNDISITVSETDFGLGAGLGYQFFGAGNTGGFAEVMYHSILSDGSSAVYLDFRGGVTFRFF